MCVFVVFVRCEHLIWIEIWGHVADIFSVIPLRVVLEFFQISTWMKNGKIEI